jgi:hypothetical protein
MSITGGSSRSLVFLALADGTAPTGHVRLRGTEKITIDTRRPGGSWDIALTTQSNASFSYRLAGRLESGAG